MSRAPALPESCEKPFYLRNRKGQRLFAVRHEVRDASGRVGVVSCHPFGAEKQFSYRPYVKLARRLMGADVPSVRFDCVGFGDSEGDLRQASVTTMIEDTLDAIEHLCAVAGVEDVVLFGARLGGTLAAMTAERDSRVRGLALVAPIVDGGRYWDSLIFKQRMAALSRGEKPATAEALWSILERDGVLEIGSQLVGLEFAEQLAALDLVEAVPDFDGAVFLSVVGPETPNATEAERLIEHYRSRCECTVWKEQERDFWSQRSMYDPYVPERLFDRFVQWMDRWR